MCLRERLKMNLPKNAAKLLAPMVLALAAACGQAQAVTLDFDTGLSGTIYSNYGGLNWSNFDVLNSSFYQPSGYVAGTISPSSVAFNAYGNAASFNSGAQFTFNSAYFTAAWSNGLIVDVQGYLGGSLVKSTSFTLDTTAASLITFNWANIDQVTFVSHGGVDAGLGGSGTHFALDNVTLNAVPEPSSFALVIAGLGIFGLMSKRRAA
ncbi:MAG: PEP-CTERM sorting domain-containing protein [Leptothrix sp. (in: Bacteria)]|nr:PEP-CTERM sorting domain-containing protein [Leptothrix sp. (in: b-proteobacteria)]